jgi:Cu-Zn family superoxide dismutase
VRTTSASRILAIAAVTTGAVLFAASPSIAGADSVRSEDRIYRYDLTEFPEDATARVRAVYNAAGDTFVTLQVTGLEPGRTYGAHAHTKPCGLSGTDAGPHFQHQPFPEGSSATDPAYANPGNEIWLDVATNAAGKGSSLAKQAWQFSPERAPKSVIIHAEPTATGQQDGDAGTAGARLACVDVGF